MTISFILNGEDVTISSEADARLIDILRENFGLLGAKSGCLAGKCGACSIIFNRRVSPACLIPAFRVRGSEVITIEGFSQTDEYQDIMTGFAQANLENCGYCNTGKILTGEALLQRMQRPARKEILYAFSGIKCRCADPETLINAMICAADIRQRRLYDRSA